MIVLSIFFLFFLPGGLICENSLIIKNADDFRTSGVLRIQGWTWLKHAGQAAEWTWMPIHADPAEACLNFELLVTNKNNGGCGYSCRIKVTIHDLLGNLVTSGTVLLSNPFRPRYSENTHGAGYTAYGSFCGLKLARTLKNGFVVRVEWPPMGSQYHLAVAKEKVTLAYVTGLSNKKIVRERRLK